MNFGDGIICCGCSNSLANLTCHSTAYGIVCHSAKCWAGRRREAQIQKWALAKIMLATSTNCGRKGRGLMPSASVSRIGCEWKRLKSIPRQVGNRPFSRRYLNKGNNCFIRIICCAIVGILFEKWLLRFIVSIKTVTRDSGSAAA